MKVAKWPTHALGDLVSFKSGGTPARERIDFWNGSIPWFSGKDLKTLRLHDSIEHISAHAVGKGTRTTPKGTILVLVRGMTLMKEVPVGLLHRDAAFNQDIKGILTNDDSLDPEFLAYYLRAENQRIRNSVTVAGHGTGRLPLEALEEYPVPLPPLSEQRKIADILSTWDESLETLDALIVAKDRQKKALMQQLLTGKTRVKGAKGKWLYKRLDEVFERIERKAPSNPDHVLSITAGRGFVDQREKFSRVIAGRNLENYVYLKKGEFSYNKGNSDRYPQGCVYRLEEFEAGAVPNVWISFRIPDESKSNALFYKHFFLSGGLNHELHSRINSGVRNDGLLNLTASNFFTVKVPVPPIEEQKAIGLLCESLSQELTLLRTQRQTLDQQKRGLMQRLLTGRIRVKPN